MKGKTKRLEILEKGAEIILIKGFNNTGINEILKAANIPKGSFYFYFKDKEAFGLQLIDFFLERFLMIADQHLEIQKLPYLAKLRNFFDTFLKMFENSQYTGGCPIGNFSLEMSDINENFRLHIQNSFNSMQKIVESFLTGAIKNSEISLNLNISEMSEFIINSWEGALMRVKVRKNSEPMYIFYKLIFDQILKPGMKNEA